MRNMTIPMNSRNLTNEEMVNVSGGERYVYYLNNNDCKGLCFALCGTLVGLSVPALMATVDVTIMTIAAFVPGMAGLTTAMFGSVAADFVRKMTEICMSNTKGLRIEYEYPLDISFTVTESKYGR